MGSRVGVIGAQWVETLAAVSNGLNLLPRTHRVVFFWPPHVCTVASMHPWKQQGVGRRKRKKKEKVNIKMQFLKWDIYFPPNSSNKQLLVPTIFSKLPSSHAAHSARRGTAQWWASWIQNPEVLHLTVRSVPCKLCGLGKLPDVCLGFLHSKEGDHSGAPPTKILVRNHWEVYPGKKPSTRPCC